MPLPIIKVKDNYIEPNMEKRQDVTTLIPLLQPFLMVQKDQKREKEMIKKIWLSSKTVNQNRIEVTADASLKDLTELSHKGFIRGSGNTYELTPEGSKLLKESILNDEKSSITKQASKQMTLKNSYDFGDEVLVRVIHAEKFGTRYIAIAKDKFPNKNAALKTFGEYTIATKKANGSEKTLSEYSEEELVQVLHLAKKIIDNAHKIIISGKTLEHVPVNRIKSFSEIIMKELNSRKDG